MPELPDVEGHRITLTQHLRGARIRSVQVLDPGVLRNATPASFRDQLIGHRFETPKRHGKWLILPTDGPILLIHNGMTGHPYFTPADSDAETDAHDRVVLSTDNGELHYADLRKLRGIWIVHTEAEVAHVMGEQGPDALAISVEELRLALRRRASALKTVLMNQRAIAGLGNMLSDEICWRARVHPARRASALSDDEVRRMQRIIQQTLRTAVRHGRIPRTRGWLNSTRDRDPAWCPRCATSLRRTTIAGRTSLWCPTCQPS